MSHTVLSFSKLSTGYADRVVSENLTARLEPEKVTCLLGSNGAGKSTLLRTLAGYQSPLGGSLGKVSPDTLGVVLTERMELQGMTAWDVVALGRHPYTGYFGSLSSEDARKVDDALTMAGIETFASRRFASLSDGERQKVMIAKVLAQETAIILMDEPTAFLDFPSKVQLMLLLRSLAHRQGKAILLSTHDVALAMKTADVLWLMENKGMEVGTPAELLQCGSIGRYLGESREYV